jgi:hypothetical protein
MMSKRDYRFILARRMKARSLAKMMSKRDHGFVLVRSKSLPTKRGKRKLERAHHKQVVFILRGKKRVSQTQKGRRKLVLCPQIS